MQNNINNDKQDAFSEMIRQKLENHKTEVDKGTWNEIEARLKSEKRRIIPFWFWITGGAAVATLALLLTLQQLKEPNDSTARLTTTKIQQAKGENRPIANYHQQKAIQSAKKTVKPIQFIAQISSPPKSSVGLDYPPAVMVIHDTIENKETKATIQDDNLKGETDIAQNSTEHKDTLSGKIRYIPNSLVAEPIDKPTAKTKNKSVLLLAASFSSNENTLTGNSDLFLSDGNKNIVSSTTSFTNIMTPNDFSNINYLPPISFELAIRKDLNKTLGLESGLVYTYLLTTFENSSVQQNNAKLHLHYIGIPLNLIVRLWNNAKWEIYVLGGGMIEKGIRSIYVQNLHTGNQTYTTTVSTSINGIQWSVNGAVGTTYKIQRNIGFFFEPKIAYYFDNNQPLSFRTEHPVSMGLTAGIRFQLK